MKIHEHSILLAVLGAFALATPAVAQTVVVTTAADVTDINWQTATVADLPGPDGLVSFEEALIATNNTPGPQTIEFRMPQNTWQQQGLFSGIAVISITNNFFMKADEQVFIDGTTQTAFTGDTNPDGWEVMLFGTNLRLNGDGCEIRGFHGTQLNVNGSNCVVEGNTGHFNLELFGGSNSLLKDNECATIKIDRSNQNVVIGNTMDRIRIWGFGSAQLNTGCRVGGPTLAERNVIAGYGTVNSEGLPSGTLVELFDVQDLLIENNWIGTKDGLTQGSTISTIGISFQGQCHDTIVRDNLISGILGHGQGPHHAGQLFGWSILPSGTGSNVSIVGNVIGADVNGDPTLGSVWGVSMGDAVTNPANYTNFSVGGLAPGEGNEIAGHLLNGVTVGRNVPQLRLQGNSIHDNGWLGIDLVPTGFGYGVDPNDAFDVDTGGSGLQNFPEVLSAESGVNGLRVKGRMRSSAADTFTLDFFVSTVCDPSGFGEGETYLGSTQVVTGGNGVANFDVTLPFGGGVGSFVTTTATREPIGATSEFSDCVAITGLHCQDDLGFQGPGTATMTACGDVLGAGGVAELAITGMPPLTPVYLGAHTIFNPTPLFGGTVVPYPAPFIFTYASDVNGEFHLPLFGGTPVPLEFYVQAAYFDVTQPSFLGLTNALRVEFLP
ncbi:MAG: hypothetical protein R3F34_18795 [Planctomycetota bacterium]